MLMCLSDKPVNSIYTQVVNLAGRYGEVQVYDSKSRPVTYKLNLYLHDTFMRHTAEGIVTVIKINSIGNLICWYNN